MANLHFDADSVSAVAAGADTVAEDLAASPVTATSGSQPSHAGVSAIDAALAGVRDRQATRVSDHAQYLKIASGVYRHVDDDGAAAITRTV
ncbi:hypothetical protein H7H51_23640 [Mycolicibacterium farcinogenes]|nr:hypothetical protein [Mycolicibacterium farcinogenes]